MAPETTPETTQPETVTSQADNVTTTEDAAQPKTEGNASAPVTYTEAQYKGLQAVIAKKDADIKQLTEKNIQLEAQVAELESNHGKVANEKSTLDSKLTETKQEASTLKEENAKLLKKLSHQDIIMKEFPDLASAASFIPETETEDEFREKAKEFRTALKQIVDTGVKDVLSGSSPPVEPSDDGATLGVDELDKAYRDVVALAGQPNKRQEYEKARERYEAILDARQPI
jgi:chromosome segregation ATPase